MFSIVFKAILSAFTGSVLPSLERAYKAKLDADTEEKKLAAEANIKLLEERAATIQAGMRARWFWIPWSMFAVSLAFWWVLVMIDTCLPFVHLGIGDLPNSIKPWANTIFNNLFISGGAVGGLQVIGGAITRLRK